MTAPDLATHWSSVFWSAAVAGALVGGLLTGLKDIFLNWLKNRPARRYLSILVGGYLGQYVEGCLRMALDDGYSSDPIVRHEQEQENTLEAQASVPEFRPLDLKVEWQLLPNQLLKDILSIPGRQAAVESRVAFESENPNGDAEDYFEVRREQWAYHGLEVIKVADELQKLSGLKATTSRDEWTVATELQNIIDKIATARKKYEALVAVSRAKRLKEDPESLV